MPISCMRLLRLFRMVESPSLLTLQARLIGNQRVCRLEWHDQHEQKQRSIKGQSRFVIPELGNVKPLTRSGSGLLLTVTRQDAVA